MSIQILNQAFVDDLTHGIEPIHVISHERDVVEDEEKADDLDFQFFQREHFKKYEAQRMLALERERTRNKDNNDINNIMAVQTVNSLLKEKDEVFDSFSNEMVNSLIRKEKKKEEMFQKWDINVYQKIKIEVLNELSAVDPKETQKHKNDLFEEYLKTQQYNSDGKFETDADAVFQTIRYRDVARLNDPTYSVTHNRLEEDAFATLTRAARVPPQVAPALSTERTLGNASMNATFSSTSSSPFSSTTLSSDTNGSTLSPSRARGSTSTIASVPNLSSSLSASTSASASSGPPLTSTRSLFVSPPQAIQTAPLYSPTPASGLATSRSHTPTNLGSSPSSSSVGGGSGTTSRLPPLLETSRSSVSVTNGVAGAGNTFAFSLTGRNSINSRKSMGGGGGVEKEKTGGVTEGGILQEPDDVYSGMSYRLFTDGPKSVVGGAGGNGSGTIRSAGSGKEGSLGGSEKGKGEEVKKVTYLGGENTLGMVSMNRQLADDKFRATNAYREFFDTQHIQNHRNMLVRRELGREREKLVELARKGQKTWTDSDVTIDSHNYGSGKTTIKLDHFS